MKVLVLGYYGRHNLGDEMFSFVFKKYFQRYWPEAELVIQNADNLNEIPGDVTAVVCGGGDLINDYFLQKIHRLVDPKLDHLPVYSVGVGIPYPNMIDEGALDVFDFVIHRNKMDEEGLLEKYGPSRVQFFPDLGFMLPLFSGKEIITPEYRRLASDSGKKIGVFLSRTIFHPNHPHAYEQILDNIAYFLVKLARTKREIKLKKLRSKCLLPKFKYQYQIYLIPSSTNPDSKRENDQLINQDLFNRMKTYGEFENVHLIEIGMQMPEILPIFKNFDLTICTRYHAHIFSILAHVPILSISSSRKIENLLFEGGIADYGIKMPVDPQFLAPTKLDCWPLFEKYHKIMNEYDQYVGQLEELMELNRREMKKFRTYFKNLLFTPIKYTGIETPAFLATARAYTRYIARRMIFHYFPNLKKDDPPRYQEYLEGLINEQTGLNSDERFNVHDLVELAGEVKDEETKKFLAQLVSFIVTGIRKSKYNYGLVEQIMTPDYHLFESVRWILNDHQQESSKIPLLHNQVMARFRKFNMHYFKQHDLEGFHRSGWTYVVDNLEYFHHNNGPIFDSFLDKTFCWDYDFYVRLGILPFKQNWIGVFHHTADTEYSDNNLVEVFKKPCFLESLRYCQGIYVLSLYLKHWLTDHLAAHGHADILVDVLTHPTEFPEVTFDCQKFADNPEKRVIQIGAWLRNSYAIYALPKPKHFLKTAIKGKNMDHYYPKEYFLPAIKESLYSIGCGDGGAGGCCRPHSIEGSGEAYCNKYLVGLYQTIEEAQNSVEVLGHVTNGDYDHLLSENVVFINLVDASAVNTVIECIVRNTPLVINRLPAMEEYLGKDYPLYYGNLVEAEAILNDFSLLQKGHEYLAKMDKSRFEMNYFLKDVIASRIFQKLEVEE